MKDDAFASSDIQTGKKSRHGTKAGYERKDKMSHLLGISHESIG